MDQNYNLNYIVVYSFPVRLALQCASTVCVFTSVIGIASGISVYTILLRSIIAFFILGIFGWSLGILLEDIDKKSKQEEQQEGESVMAKLPDSKAQTALDAKQQILSKEKAFKEPVTVAGLKPPSTDYIPANIPVPPLSIPVGQTQPIKNGNNTPITFKKVVIGVPK